MCKLKSFIENLFNKRNEIREIDDIDHITNWEADLHLCAEDPIPYDFITVKGLLALAVSLNKQIPPNSTKSVLYKLVFGYSEQEVQNG